MKPEQIFSTVALAASVVPLAFSILILRDVSAFYRDYPKPPPAEKMEVIPTTPFFPKCVCGDRGLEVTGSCTASPMDVEECDRKRPSTFIVPWATSPKARVCVKGKCMTLEDIEKNGRAP